MSDDTETEAAEETASPLRLEHTELMVAGMCCQSEVGLIHTKLEKIDGVQDVKANLVLRRVTVTHTRAVSADKLLRTLNWSLLGASLVEKGASVGIRHGKLGSPEGLLASATLLLFLVACGIWARPEGMAWYKDPFSYAALACVAVGSPVLLVRAISGLVLQRTLNMYMTMSIAVLGALLLLDLWEAAAIVFFSSASEFLASWCVHHTADQTRSLSTILPETVRLQDGVTEKPLESVAIGDVLLVKPGWRVPADGVVVEGTSSVDEALLTGESMPVHKTAGAHVTAGTTNHLGVLHVRCERLPSECSAAQISSLVSEASKVGARQLVLERFAKLYTTAVLLAALLLATVPLGWCEWAGDAADDGTLVGHAHSHAQCAWWLRRALVLTVLSCPCSLIVAMPITYACGIAALAKTGVLIKSPRQLELLSSLRALAVDKTGTLTEGRFRMRQIKLGPAACGEAEGLLALACAAERNSSHPIADAFLEFGDSLGVHVPHAAAFRLLEGEGIEATVDGQTVHVGSERLARRVLAETAALAAAMPRLQAAIDAHVIAAKACADANPDEMPRRMIAALKKKEEAARVELQAARAEALSEAGVRDDSTFVQQWASGGASVLWVLVDGEVGAACQLSDQVRGETPTAVRMLHEMGVDVTMLTGDAEPTAQAVRARLGIAHARAGMKPHDKLAAIRELKQLAVTGMIGDGVNDGPALAAADVGIAMGVNGTALASAAAGVVLMTNDLRRVCDAIVSARRTTKTLKRSVVAALALKLAPLVLMFTVSHAEGFLIAAAVGSDIVGVMIVLLAAMALISPKTAVQPQFAAAACTNNESSLQQVEVVMTAEGQRSG